ncbi:MAG: UDP-N-acetylmuramoyl-L-alanyl-D-glutamate--2,6-diaminopimelate ligase [Actinobacteria bacterium]|nr:UDP-N-acetylmuramoyl-L-alanyl-D-glutamate--2,6-diaminopimelate ligase [Actinomycetota bacterium]
MAEHTAGALSDLIGSRLLGTPAALVTSITLDSRSVQPGALFCCVPGALHDGHDHAAAAVEAGATALLVERELPLPVPQLLVDDVRLAMGPLAAAIYDNPTAAGDRKVRVVGVTGTNGKTTTVTLVAQILDALGVAAATIGTLTGARTTPEAPELQAQFRQFAESGVEVVAIEVSSHALALHRVDGTRFEVSVFTNIGIDHLDFHHTQEQYFAAKARLFEPSLSEQGVVNLDDVHGRLLRDASTIPMTGFSVSALDDLVFHARGARFTWRGERVELPLVGRFNVANALGAAEAVRALGFAESAIASAMAELKAPGGRFEVVDAGQPFLVVVDYAHTPDALENVLLTARDLVDRGKLRVVFGCGGDRDVSKRPQMGAVAARLADEILITSDNPRSEDPSAIIEAVKAGSSTPLASIVDRRDAIETVLAEAGPGDVVVIAGKGHETTQTIGSTVIPFDDRAVAATWLASRDWGSA